jgi:hypothetical protein
MRSSELFYFLVIRLQEPPKDKSRFLSAPADPFARKRIGKKKSACFVRNDSEPDYGFFGGGGGSLAWLRLRAWLSRGQLGKIAMFESVD